MMARFDRVAGAMAVWLFGFAGASGQEPPSPPKPKLKAEFRWAEDKPVKGVTEDKGIDLSCTERKAYLHTRAVLTNRDIAAARTRKATAAPAPGFTIEVDLTPEAAKRMAKSSAENLKKPLVVLVDGKVVAAMVVMSRLADLVPVTGNFTQAEAERIVKGIE